MSDLRRQPRDPLEEGPSSHPLTPLQEAMLFHGLKDGDHSYLQIMVCDFEEPIDSVAFFDSWKELVERHDVLRTSFAHDSSGMPVQVVHGQISIPWEEQDWRHWSGEKQQSRFSAFLRDERKRGFDLATPPPLRLSLLRFEDEHYRLVWTSHHALFDGRSRLILLRDLFRLYDGVVDAAVQRMWQILWRYLLCRIFLVGCKVGGHLLTRVFGKQPFQAVSFHAKSTWGAVEVKPRMNFFVRFQIGCHRR